MTSLTNIVMDQTKQFCDHVTPLIERNMIRQHSTTLQIDQYSVTISIVKNPNYLPSLLGKRSASAAVPAEDPARSLRQFMEPSKTPSEFYPKSTDSLFNSMGHNFCPMAPQQNVVVTDVSYIS